MKPEVNDTDARNEVRLLPVSDADWPSDISHLNAGFAGRLNIYRVMAHHPGLLAAWETLRNHVVLSNALAPQQLEAVILRTGHRWLSPYEWAHHVVRGRAAGLSEQDIEAASGAAQDWTDETAHKLVMEAVDQLLDTGRISKPALDILGREIGAEGIFDLMAAVGMYTTLAFVANSFAVAIDSDVAERLGDPAEAHRAAGADAGSSSP